MKLCVRSQGFNGLYGDSIRKCKDPNLFFSMFLQNILFLWWWLELWRRKELLPTLYVLFHACGPASMKRQSMLTVLSYSATLQLPHCCHCLIRPSASLHRTSNLRILIVLIYSRFAWWYLPDVSHVDFFSSPETDDWEHLSLVSQFHRWFIYMFWWGGGVFPLLWV